jgi:hypothetical protein
MKREILFKAKRVDNGEWVYGHLLSYRSIGKWGNCENYSYTAIMPDTVCQFTGLTDKNGNKIFEGDSDGVHHIEWNKLQFRWSLYNTKRDCLVAHLDAFDLSEFEIIGNIYEEN